MMKPVVVALRLWGQKVVLQQITVNVLYSYLLQMFYSVAYGLKQKYIFHCFEQAG